MLQKLKRLSHSHNQTIEQKGDLSLLLKLVGHANKQNCNICLQHCPSTNSLEILQQISISKGTQNNAPKIIKVKVVGEPLFPELSNTSGDYVMQDSFINNLPFWRHSKLTYIIWYNIDDALLAISHSKDIGTSKWIFAAPVGNNLKWPNEVSFKGSKVPNLHEIIICRNKIYVANVFIFSSS